MGMESPNENTEISEQDKKDIEMFNKLKAGAESASSLEDLVDNLESAGFPISKWVKGDSKEITLEERVEAIKHFAKTGGGSFGVREVAYVLDSAQQAILDALEKFGK